MTAVVSLGSNLGDRLGHLRAAIEMLGERFPVLATSPVYETEPVGGVEQPAFLNLVLLLGTDDAEAVLQAGQAAEEARGRLRGVRWGPRTLDVDVVAVGAQTSADARLTLPHPRAAERAFVLVPWLDVDPDAMLPGAGPVRALARRATAAGLRRWDG